MASHDSPAVTYSSYLMLDQLLSAQSPRSAEDRPEAEHDELLFIIIHQVYELWFKQMLHESDYAITNLQQGDSALVLHTLKRIRTILKVIVSQLDVLETMTPLQFSSFRDRLQSASGLQSAQFRELEFVLGIRDESILERYQPGSGQRERLVVRLKQPSLWDAFLEYLSIRGYEVGGDNLQEVLVDIYRNNAEITQICEALVDVDEGLQEWRYRHVKMVQRTIGSKIGTGGTHGVEYLTGTLGKMLFPELWAVRAAL